MTSTSNKIVPILLALIALSAGIFLSSKLTSSNESATPPDIRGLLWPSPNPIGNFKLLDQQAKPFTQDSLKGHWSMLFFGYTHCPDICPSTMNLLNNVSSELIKQKATAPQIIFVSVDPQRDTPQHLLDYMAFFNPQFIGLSGDETDLAGLTKQLGIVSMKVENKDASDTNDYLMDHSSSILLIDPQARLVGIFSTPHDQADIRKRFLAIQAFIEQQ